MDSRQFFPHECLQPDEQFIKASNAIEIRRSCIHFAGALCSLDVGIGVLTGTCRRICDLKFARMRSLITLELFVIGVIINATRGTSRVEAHRPSKAAASEGSSWLVPELLIVHRVYESCQEKNDFIGCLKQKALRAISRALEQDSIKITDGLILEKQNNTEKESILETISDARDLDTLAPIDRALLLKADKFARTHALKIDIGTGREGGGGGGGGLKKKKDKGSGHVKYVVAALLTAMGIAGPIGLKALAAIAGKALVISKVALTIAGIIALKKLFSHDHHEETSFQVHAGDHNRRSTYVIRPVSKPNAQPVTSTSVDPYRYYYEYH